MSFKKITVAIVLLLLPLLEIVAALPAGAASTRGLQSKKNISKTESSHQAALNCPTELIKGQFPAVSKTKTFLRNECSNFRHGALFFCSSNGIKILSKIVFVNLLVQVILFSTLGLTELASPNFREGLVNKLAWIAKYYSLVPLVYSLIATFFIGILWTIIFFKIMVKLALPILGCVLVGASPVLVTKLLLKSGYIKAATQFEWLRINVLCIPLRSTSWIVLGLRALSRPMTVLLDPEFSMAKYPKLSLPLYTIIIAPLREELYYRFAMDKLCRVFGRRVNQRMASAVFALSHIPNWYGGPENSNVATLFGHTNPVGKTAMLVAAISQCAVTFIMSRDLLWPLYEQAGLGASLGAHTVWNALFLIIMSSMKLFSRSLAANSAKG